MNQAPEVEAALALFAKDPNPDHLTLEQIMMCVYLRPCRRISPKQWKDTRYLHGSSLVFMDEVILILEPDDNSLYLPVNVGKRTRVLTGPRKHYRGLCIGSRFFTPETFTIIDNLEMVRETRHFMKLSREHSQPVERGASFFEPNSQGQLNNHRCQEAWRLMGRASGMRLRGITTS